MSEEESPRWFPHSIYIASYQTDDPEKKLDIQETINRLYDKYGGSRSSMPAKLEFTIGPISGYVKEIVRQASQVLLVATGSIEAKTKSSGLITPRDEYDQLIEDLKKSLPENPGSAYSLKSIYTPARTEAAALIEGWARNLGQPVRSAGLVKGCLVATVKSFNQDSLLLPSKRLIISPCEQGFGEASKAVWMMCSDISALAACVGQMNRLYSERELIFSQTEAGETSTQLRINEILAELRRPLDEIQPKNLEAVLKEITVLFSRLSTASNSMRRDYIKAKGIFREMSNLLAGWSERSVDDYITNSSAEMHYVKDLMVPFRDFAQRTEALMAQLNTVLDSVRTYLGIQQHKLSIAEQTSSKEQLIRLVNLQETLHKLEILIVAVYLTEMARIVFETLLHESAGFLTVAFIPVALLISLFLGRILHKNH